jgi:hypothetical protein
MINNQKQSSRGKDQKEPPIPFPGPIEPEQEVDTRVCYECQQTATAICTHCKQPVCEEHRQPVKELVTKLTITLCDDCAKRYEDEMMPY